MADYDALGEWPLAITAYNHGRGGVSRRTGEVNSVDIGDVVMGYRGKAFGFASRNFYVEFLAAVDVASRADGLFGDLPHMPAVEGERSSCLRDGHPSGGRPGGREPRGSDRRESGAAVERHRRAGVHAARLPAALPSGATSCRSRAPEPRRVERVQVKAVRARRTGRRRARAGDHEGVASMNPLGEQREEEPQLGGRPR